MTENKESYPDSFCTWTWWLELRASLPRNPWRKWPVLACWPQVTSYHCFAFVRLCFPKLRSPWTCVKCSPRHNWNTVLFLILHPPHPPAHPPSPHPPIPFQEEEISSMSQVLSETAPVGLTTLQRGCLFSKLTPPFLSLFQAWIIFWLLVPAMFLLPPFYLSEPLLSYRNNLALGPKICRAGQLGCVRHSLNASSLLLSERLQTPGREGGAVSVLSMGEREGTYTLHWDVFSQFSKIELTSLWPFFL